MLGADRIQLSSLVGGQLAIVTFISSFIGSLIAIVPARGYYYLIQKQVGESYFPSITIKFSLLGFILTIIFFDSPYFFRGGYNTYRLLDNRNLFEEGEVKTNKSKFSQFMVLGMNILLWFSLVAGSLIVPHLDLPGGIDYKLSFLLSAVFYLLVILSICHLG